MTTTDHHCQTVLTQGLWGLRTTIHAQPTLARAISWYMNQDGVKTFNPWLENMASLHDYLILDVNSNTILLRVCGAVSHVWLVQPSKTENEMSMPMLTSFYFLLSTIRKQNLNASIQTVFFWDEAKHYASIRQTRWVRCSTVGSSPGFESGCGADCFQEMKQLHKRYSSRQIVQLVQWRKRSVISGTYTTVSTFNRPFGGIQAIVWPTITYLTLGSMCSLSNEAKCR